MDRIMNKGSLTIEISVVMTVYMFIILMLFQAFFLLAKNVNVYCEQADMHISIEKTVESMRRWQFIGGDV